MGGSAVGVARLTNREDDHGHTPKGVTRGSSQRSPRLDPRGNRLARLALAARPCLPSDARTGDRFPCTIHAAPRPDSTCFRLTSDACQWHHRGPTLFPCQ
jgi:hypothetical protein